MYQQGVPHPAQEMRMPSIVRAIVLAISLLVVIGFAAIFSREISTTPYFRFDEFFSLERSVGFIKFDDWTQVYSLNKPSTRKPPLQYWLNAIDVKLGVPELLAFKLWSYLFLLGSIIATGLLAVRICKGNLWALPAAMLLIGGSEQLIVAGRSAMLDSGQCFFLVASLLSFFYAKDNARWWLVCGAMVGLGSLQKTPVALLFVGVMLAVLNKRGDEYYRWRNLRQLKPFNSGFYLSLVLLISWPLLQTILIGVKYIRSMHHEMLARLNPVGEERFENGDFFKWIDWLWTDFQITGAIALLCVLLMLAFKKWRNDSELTALLAVAVMTMIGFSLATGTLYARYLVVLTPLLAVFIVRLSNDLLRWKPAVLILAIALTAISAPRIQAAIDIAGKSNAFDQFEKARSIVARIDAVRAPRDVIFVDSQILPPGAYGYFGKSLLPYYSRKLSDNAISTARTRRELASIEGPVLGITSPNNTALIAALSDEYQKVYEDAEIIIWRQPAPTLAVHSR